MKWIERKQTDSKKCASTDKKSNVQIFMTPNSFKNNLKEIRFRDV